MKRKILSVMLVIALMSSFTVSAYASYNLAGGYYSNYNSYNYSGYYGEDYYNYNYKNSYSGNYYMSSWAESLEIAYEPTWHEQPQRQVARGEAFLLFLRAMQHSLDRQGYSRLNAGYNKPPFSDYYNVTPNAQLEVNVLWSNGILVGYEDDTMRFSKPLTRAEMAAIYSRFNRIYFNMGAGYSQYSYDGYSNYYNNNYNNYYNRYMFNDIQGHWAQQDIVTAASNGVLAGVGNGYFDTEGKLTIEQIWKILDCCAGYQGLKRSDIAYAMSQTFKVTFGKNIDEEYGTANGVKITKLSTSLNTVSIGEGEKENIKVTITPNNAQYQKLNWSSSNTKYVSIEESWNSSSGTAYVTIYGRKYTSSYVTLTGRAMDGSGKSVTIKVKVNKDSYDYDDDGYITSITPSQTTIYLKKGESKQLNAKIKPSYAYNKNLSWTSKDTSVAYTSNVYSSGNYSYATITGNNVGTTYIYVKALDGSGEKESVKVIVQEGAISGNLITSAIASPSSVSLEVGNMKKINITIYPTNAIDKNITWISDNENVAYVEKLSNTAIKIVAVGMGNTTIRGTADSTGNVVCAIPVYVTNVGGNTSIGDNTPPVVTLEGATSVNIGEAITITARASDETSLQSFRIGVNSIIGMTGSLSPTKIEKISNTEYRITLMGVEVASQCICISAGAAVDSAGNTSAESNEIVIFVNSGE